MTNPCIRTILTCVAPAMLVAQQLPQRDLAVHSCRRADSLIGPIGNLAHITALEPEPGRLIFFLPNTETTHPLDLRPALNLAVPQVPDDSLPTATLVVGFSADVALALVRRVVDPVTVLQLDQAPTYRLPK